MRWTVYNIRKALSCFTRELGTQARFFIKSAGIVQAVQKRNTELVKVIRLTGLQKDALYY